MDPIETPISISNRRVIKISRKKVLWTFVILVLLGLALMLLLGMGLIGPSYRSRSLSTGDIPMVSPEENMTSRGYYPDIYYNRPDITDTREFNKVSYSAELQTRRVADTVEDIKNEVRDVSGRVDAMNMSKEYGSISFIVPKAKFEEFKAEVKKLVNARLYVENISIQNRLGEKQAIEKQAEDANTSLADLETSKKDLDTKHSQTLASLNAQLSTVQVRLQAVRQDKSALLEQGDEADPKLVAEVQAEELGFMQQETRIRQQINSENASYNSQNTYLTSRINQAKSNVQIVAERDMDFTNDIETVNGSVRVEWISIWGLMVAFSPLHPIWIILILAIAAIFILNKKGYIPKVEFV